MWSLGGKSLERKTNYGKITKKIVDPIKCIFNTTARNQHMRIDLQNFGIVKKANMSGVIFKENLVILHHINGVNQLLTIRKIFCKQQKTCLFFVNFLYDDHVRAYIKLKSLPLLNGNPQYKLINISDVLFEPSLLIKLPTGDLALKIYRKLKKYELIMKFVLFCCFSK